MTKWSLMWPEEPGWYWFYGHEFPVRTDDTPERDPRLVPVHVIKGSKGVVHIAGGHFLYPSEATGVWIKATLPTLPGLVEQPPKITIPVFIQEGDDDDGMG